MRFRPRNDDSADVPLSPLIDCVFLLLIFFLVTSMIKRHERQIPVTLADPTAAISVQTRADAFRFGIDRDGHVYAQTGRRSKFGSDTFAPVGDVPAYLHAFAATHPPDRAIELLVERGTPFQRVIDVLDVFELQGFERVRSRVTHGRIRLEEG